jgi:hypothetical protein
VTEFPELQHALVDAAGRYHAPRRRALRLVRAAVPVAAATAAIAVGVVLVAGDDPGGEQAVPPVATVEPTDALSRTFELYRRPATADDKLPLTGERLEQFRRPDPTASARLDTERVRLLSADGDRRLYVIAATIQERPGACLVVFSGELQENGACSPIGPRGDMSLLYLPLYDPSAPAGVIAAIAADGVEEMELRFSDGSSERRRFDGNVVYARLDRWPSGLAWTDPGGRTHTATLTPEEAPWNASRSCPTLDPLPEDAEARAREAALAEAPRLYRGMTEATVEDVRPAAANAAGCGPNTADRALEVWLRLAPAGRSASLSQGRVLVGAVGGRMMVWHVLH